MKDINFSNSIGAVQSWDTSGTSNNGNGNGWGPGGNGGSHHPPWAGVPEANAFGGILIGGILLWFIFLRRIRK